MHFRYSLLCLVSVFTSQVFSRPNLKGCNFDTLNTNKEKFQPLLFHNYTTYYELVVPEKGQIHLNLGDWITLACLGKKNYLIETNSNTTSATCIGENTLKIFRKEVGCDDLQCKKEVRSNVRTTGKRCGNDEGYIKEIGYQITRNEWVTLIEICYDDDRGVTLYTKHDLIGNEIAHAAKITDRPGFSTDGMGTDIAASVAYTQVFQKSTFNRLLSSACVAEHYVNNRSYLARGHLSPNADFVLTSSRRASFYFINAFPQWQTINGGNWKSVEISIRKAAEDYNRTFTIITGTYKVLALPDINQNLIPIYLSRNKLPVPEKIWKIVYDRKTQMGIAIIVVNNPFVETISGNDLLCANICNQYGWGTKNWYDTTRGYAYCCDLEKFLKIVRIAPRLEVKGVLQSLVSL